MTVLHPDFSATLAATRAKLLALRRPEGCWRSGLSDSALSTATASMALALVDRHKHDRLIRGGLDWLASNINADGGWGDTIASRSNINTTSLCWAALAFAPEPKQTWTDAESRGRRWIEQYVGSTQPDQIAGTILKFYGDDRTFSTPVLTMLALAERMGPREHGFLNIPALPFELAAFPQRLWRLLHLPVVSYALPALVAIGQARHFHVPPANPLLRMLRNSAKERTLGVVLRMQPKSGGFLEAIPLTSFVCACLASMNMSEHPIARDAVRFLLAQNRPNGAWPIDTCLDTWVTSLAIHALSIDGRLHERLDPSQRAASADWILRQQYEYVHPFTNTPPGGWSWMEGDGAVPDADDTPAAILALMALSPDDNRARRAIARGAQWLIDLQNRDGGVPSFCRGWGKLPFDRSAADLTAHSMRAWQRCLPVVSERLARRMKQAIRRSFEYLQARQRRDGSWLPLWFGSQWGDDQTNPCYGTARVLKGLAACGLGQTPEALRAVQWLIETARPDGGWSGGDCPPSIEETSIAVESLAMWLDACGRVRPPRELQMQAKACTTNGVEWLIGNTHRGQRFTPAPIGLYFAKLWYHEDLYPLVFCHAALDAAGRVAAKQPACCASHPS